MSNHVISYLFPYLIEYSGLGQDDSEYVDISKEEFKSVLLRAFGGAGFASTSQGEFRLLPCPTGTFVKPPVTFTYTVECVECPAGKSCL